MPLGQFLTTPRAGAPAAAEEQRVLLQNLEKTKRELDMAYRGFSQSTDPDLVEFYLFEIDAQRARHSYLLRRIKQLGAEGAAADS